MSAPCVTIVETGIANTASVAAALARCGTKAELTSDRGRIEQAERLVFPGVGTFREGMLRLERSGLVDVIRDRIRQNRPTLGICLGMQLLCAASEESPGVAGLAIVDAKVTIFPKGVMRPQFGWNLITPNDGCELLTAGYAYFANSYRVTNVPPQWSGAIADHGGTFVAALERGGVLACQFHLELSGQWGMNLLKRWLACSAGGSSC